MQHSLLPYLACPACGESLSVEVFRQNIPVETEEVQDGALLCVSCYTFYPVSQYIPRFLSDQDVRDPQFYQRYELELQVIRRTYKDARSAQGEQLRDLQTATIRNFGFEWNLWNAFGWNDAVQMEQTRSIFDYKVLKTRGELVGKLVLDAGCGNGRYTAVAAEYGGTVIGIDLSGAVDVAWKNLKHNPAVFIVQGDVFHPPFKREIFDFIFSNGVLMHTGNARQAFKSLCRFLNKTGEITIHLYHKGNIIYECVDASLRWIILKLPLSIALKISTILAKIASWIPKGLALTAVNGFVRLEPHPHYVFDWYTAPIATHHTYPEVYRWLDEEGLFLLHDHNASSRGFLRRILPFLFMTVKAAKQRPLTIPSHTRT